MKVSFGQNKNLPQKLSKPEWKSVKSYDKSNADSKIAETIPFKNEILGDMFLHSHKIDTYSNYIKTVITNKLNKQFGEELYSIDNEKGEINGINIVVNDEYRKNKNFRFGEKLRLVTIMELLENGGNGIYITSKDTAIYFHSKYKFVPCSKEFSRMDILLNDISNDKTPEFSDFANEARELQKQVLQNKENAQKLRELVKETNNLTKRYIEKALKYPNPQKNHPINTYIDMVLTKETILKNKDYFNELFEKHGIDYQIKDPQ